MRVCKKCGVEKELSEFYKTYTYARYTCKKCEGKSIAVWKKKKQYALKQRAIDYFGGSCQKCGYSKCIQALEFNHLRDKIYEPSNMFQNGMRWEVIEEELKKCELLCANCHREYTHSV